MASSLRSQFREPEEDPAADGDTEGSSDTSSGEYDAELESMTGKGIKRLCSELLELKKASDEDFQRNVYSNYPAFVRIFKEVGGVESDLTELNQHISTQRKLIQVLMNNLYLEIVSDDSRDIKVEDIEDVNLYSPSRFGTHMEDILETLDVLLLEHRLEEALVILKEETISIQKLQMEEDHLSSVITSYTYAIADRRTRLADLFAVVAEHPRVAQPELQKALFGLCRIGEDHRANILLLKFYRTRLQNNVDMLHCSKPFPHGTYIKELARIVFSAISQAAQCFVALYGETSPYTSELIQWAREETAMFSHYFDAHLKSISEMNGGLSLAVEAVNSALSFCSLLEAQRITLRSNLMKLIRPCMEKVLEMHMDHFKKVVSIFASTDNWVLGKFLIMGILKNKSRPTEVGDKVDYCLLTSSGRKFVTLMQVMVDDISPLVTLQMGSSILKGLSDLFNEYICALKRAILSTGNVVADDSPRIYSAQKLVQQLSLLVSSSTLVHIFPRIAGSIFTGIRSSNDELLSDHTELFMQNELDIWVLSVQEAADQLRVHFCQQFASRIMSHQDVESATCLESSTNGPCILSPSQDPLPSFAFQALFLQLKQVEEHFKSIFIEKDELMEKLHKDIIEAVVVWLSNNRDFWKNAEDSSRLQHCSYIEQFQLDMHFLVEIARIGQYFSDDLMDAMLDLIGQMEVELAASELDPNCAVPDEAWASNAAKLAIERLLEAEVGGSEPSEEPHATLEDELRDDECPSDGESASSVEEDMAESININIIPASSEEQVCDGITAFYDDEGSRSPTIHYVDMEDGQNVIGTDSEIETLEELGVGRSKDAEVLVVANLDGECDAIAAQSVVDEPRDTAETDDLVLETELHEVSDNLDVAVTYFNSSEGTVIAAQEDLTNFSSIDVKFFSNPSDSPMEGMALDCPCEETELDCKKSSVVIQGGNMNSHTDEGNGSSLTITVEVVQNDQPKVADETARETHSSGEEREFTGKDTDLVLERSQCKKGGDDGNPVGGSEDTSSDIARPRGRRQRFKHFNAAQGLGKNRKGSRTSRATWH